MFKLLQVCLLLYIYYYLSLSRYFNKVAITLHHHPLQQILCHSLLCRCCGCVLLFLEDMLDGCVGRGVCGVFEVLPAVGLNVLLVELYPNSLVAAPVTLHELAAQERQGYSAGWQKMVTEGSLQQGHPGQSLL